MKKECKHMDNLILTGWGWKEYAVSAAVALRALNGQADVMGMSKRRLPEFLELEGRAWKHIYLIGLSLGGDEERLAAQCRSSAYPTASRAPSGYRRDCGHLVVQPFP
jgi:hypothetical protein